MKKTTSIREDLGLTQDEAALLLKISKGQLAMYETGKRDLPVDAKLKWVALWKHVQNNKETKSILEQLKTTVGAKMKQMVEQELLVNQHKQLLLEKKINRIQKNYQKNISALQLVEYLKTQGSPKDKREITLIEMIRQKALMGIEKNGLPIQTKWNLKLNTLQLHQKELQKELNKYQ